MSYAILLDAVEKAWDRRFTTWKHYALALTGNPKDAEEVVQEAVTRTLRARPELETELEAHRYILTAVKTSALQLLQSRNRYSPLGKFEPADAERVISSPLRVLLHGESRRRTRRLADRVMASMETLRPEQREAVELLVLAEPPLKLREVAEIQDAPISTVHSRLRSALRQLGEAVGGSAEDLEPE